MSVQRRRDDIERVPCLFCCRLIWMPQPPPPPQTDRIATIQPSLFVLILSVQEVEGCLGKLLRLGKKPGPLTIYFSALARILQRIDENCKCKTPCYILVHPNPPLGFHNNASWKILPLTLKKFKKGPSIKHKVTFSPNLISCHYPYKRVPTSGLSTERGVEDSRSHFQSRNAYIHCTYPLTDIFWWKHCLKYIPAKRNSCYSRMWKILSSGCPMVEALV